MEKNFINGGGEKHSIGFYSENGEGDHGDDDLIEPSTGNLNYTVVMYIKTCLVHSLF